MKKLAFALYIVSVLLISGLARASTLGDYAPPKYQTPARIHGVHAEGQNLIVMVEATPCQHETSAALIQDTQEPTTLMLHVSTPIDTEVCSDQVVPLTTAINVPVLARASQVHLDAKTVYQIKVEGYEFSMPVVGSELLK